MYEIYMYIMQFFLYKIFNYMFEIYMYVKQYCFKNQTILERTGKGNVE